MAPADVVVIGGGIAGLAAAWHLAGRGARPVLLERELLLASHASGRNAAIFRQVDSDLVGARLAGRSRELLARLRTEAGPLLSATGAIYCGGGERLAPLEALAVSAGVELERLDRAGLARLVPALAGGEAAAGLHFPGDGVLDVHALTGSLGRGAAALGATLRIGSAVRGLRIRDGRIAGVLLEGGELIATERVVLAAGAWTAELGNASGVPLPIVPRRRHLAMLVSGRPGAVAAGRSAAGPGPVVWRVDEEVYFRPEPGGILASPCDEEEWPPGVPPTAPEALAQLALRLPRLAPGLAELSVRSAWACLRSFAPDGGLVAGADPRLPGLTVIAGLGGRGMTCGLGLAEVAAAAVLGEAHPLAELLSPARFLAARG